MNKGSVRIFSLGDSALTIEFGNVVSEDLNRRAIALARYFQENQFPGFVESVPAYASTSIFYDLMVVRSNFPEFETAFAAVEHLARHALSKPLDLKADKGRTVEIPVQFDLEGAFDLAFVAQSHGLSPNDVVKIFTEASYRVYMIGFLPGFSYMGEVEKRIATPRKETPRLVVPRGSVGIAGKQTGVYSLESPGGWQIIGRTDVELFTPDAESPSLLQSGDQVRFVAIR